MALTLGTNSGFVTVRPTADPNASLTSTIDGSSCVTKHTSPSYPARIIEIGWYRAAGTNTENWEVGLYSDSAGVADVLLQVEATNSSSSAGWLTRSVNWSISASTDYWLGLQQDASAGSSLLDREITGGAGYDIRTVQTTLNNPYGGGAVQQAAGLLAIYALIEPLFSPAWGNRTTQTIGGVF